MRPVLAEGGLLHGKGPNCEGWYAVAAAIVEPSAETATLPAKPGVWRGIGSAEAHRLECRVEPPQPILYLCSHCASRGQRDHAARNCEPDEHQSDGDLTPQPRHL